ncbi:MAG: segregation and condensation protein [Bacillota bacterium]|nr:segregation and condensation protein [Bacillota bacterium]MDK2959930.1 segregation and condensation protein [Bacillota bacterium]
MHSESVTALLEALLFAAGRPLTIKELANAAGLSLEDTELGLEELRRTLADARRGLVLREVAGGVQLFTRPEFAPYVRRLLQPAERPRLSQAALETLAIIAYRQPITRQEIEAVRGVRVDQVLFTLEERGLITEVGRKDAPGRPVLYGTTPAFLRSLGLASLKDLPPLPEVGATKDAGPA